MPSSKAIFIILISWIFASCSTLHKWTQGNNCPSEMVLLIEDPFIEGKAICLDRYEYSVPKEDQLLAFAYPLTNQNYNDCKNICAKQGKRLPSNREWQMGCQGTNPKQCNNKSPHPVISMLNQKAPWIFQGKNCKDKRYTWGICLQDPRLNNLPKSLAYNEEFSKCRSRKGAVNMVGNVGEWVSDYVHKRGKIFGRFNGGLYPQKKSSCKYTTIAHAPDYKDYSIGCRCAKDVEP